MLLEMPKDHKQCPLFTPLKRNQPAALMYWIYDENGYAKKYTEASAEETKAFLVSLTGGESSDEDAAKSLTLLPIRAVTLDIILNHQSAIHSYLFGHPKIERVTY
jgi:hypothetical protein